MYTEESHIQSVEEVKAFFTYVVGRVGDEWHPDDDYFFYKDKKTKALIVLLRGGNPFQSSPEGVFLCLRQGKYGHLRSGLGSDREKH